MDVRILSGCVSAGRSRTSRMPRPRETRTALRAAVQAFRDLGAELVDAAIPQSFAYRETLELIMNAEGIRSFRELVDTGQLDLIIDPEARAAVRGPGPGPAEYSAALRARRRLIRELAPPSGRGAMFCWPRTSSGRGRSRLWTRRLVTCRSTAAIQRWYGPATWRASPACFYRSAFPMTDYRSASRSWDRAGPTPAFLPPGRVPGRDGLASTQAAVRSTGLSGRLASVAVSRSIYQASRRAPVDGRCPQPSAHPL